jgi:TM2 domain-containing membrane protein YozV
MVYCHGCGKPIHETALTCPQCGARQQIARSEKSKLAAALLAIFLGGFGMHKFYLGQIGLGVLYLVFCWTLIPAIVGFIEGIVYLATDDRRWAEKYG